MNTASRHVPEELLEAYAMDLLSEPESAPVEEHLLFCETCQYRLAELDDFIHVVKLALAVPLEPPSAVETEPFRAIRGVRAAAGGMRSR